jgi:GWxTD domain-containing protein
MRNMPILALSFYALSLLGSVPDSVGEGRRLIGQKEYDAAIQTLQGAIPDAAGIASTAERIQAFSAIHFYSAVAFHGLGNEPKAREQLEEYFSFAPGRAKLDPAKFDRGFIRLFDDVASRSAREPQMRFDLIYPGFRTFSTDTPRERPLSEWDRSPEYVYLATDEEQTGFRRLREDRERRTFIDRFWEKRESGFRTEFETRVAFADYAFGTEEMRGSLSDRGRVFVLLGKPRVVSVKNLTRAEGATMQRSRGQIADGTVERWYFFRDQLPASAPKKDVEFKFITQPGYGEAVLSREVFGIKALDAARRQ